MAVMASQIPMPNARTPTSAAHSHPNRPAHNGARGYCVGDADGSEKALCLVDVTRCVRRESFIGLKVLTCTLPAL